MGCFSKQFDTQKLHNHDCFYFCKNDKRINIAVIGLDMMSLLDHILLAYFIQICRKAGNKIFFRLQNKFIQGSLRL